MRPDVTAAAAKAECAHSNFSRRSFFSRRKRKSARAQGGASKVKGEHLMAKLGTDKEITGSQVRDNAGKLMKEGKKQEDHLRKRAERTQRLTT
jgi:hypothetical protein